MSQRQKVICELEAIPGHIASSRPTSATDRELDSNYKSKYSPAIRYLARRGRRTNICWSPVLYRILLDVPGKLCVLIFQMIKLKVINSNTLLTITYIAGKDGVLKLHLRVSCP